MKRAILRTRAAAVAFAVLLSGGCTSAESRPADAVNEVRQQFIGNWELLSYVAYNAEGQPTDMNYVGRIMYDEAGNMSGIGMPRDLPQRDRVQGEPLPRSGFAYFSTFDVDVEEGRVIHHVLGSPMNPNWVGTDLVRYYEFTEDRLALSIRNAEGRVTGTLTWRRLQ